MKLGVKHFFHPLILVVLGLHATRQDMVCYKRELFTTTVNIVWVQRGTGTMVCYVTKVAIREFVVRGVDCSSKAGRHTNASLHVCLLAGLSFYTGGACAPRLAPIQLAPAVGWPARSDGRRF